MANPEISIIIPAYNVEMWLERAVGSMLSQTFGDFEILLVDDGSTDGTGGVCDSLAEADSRVRVIHQENRGAAAARNVAMAKAQGKYLYFMDGDDWAEPNMLEDMHALAEAHGLDLVVAGFYIDTYFGKDEFYREVHFSTDYVFEDREHFRASAYALFDAQLLYAPWNKLYRRAYIAERDITFPETFWDDLPFNLEVVRDIGRVGCIGKCYYHFLRARSEAENTRYRKGMYEKREEENEWIHELYSYWGLEDDPDSREFIARRYAERLLGCIENLTCADCELSREEKRAEARRIIASPEAKRALLEAKPTSAMLAALFRVMKTGNVDLVLAQSSFISFVKRNNTHLFAALKANR